MKATTNICDKGCGEAFTIDTIHEDELKDGVSEVYFNCSHCGHKYIAYYTNDEFKELQAEIKKLTNRMGHLSRMNKPYGHLVPKRIAVRKRAEELMAELKVIANT